DLASVQDAEVGVRRSQRQVGSPRKPHGRLGTRNCCQPTPKTLVTFYDSHLCLAFLHSQTARVHVAHLTQWDVSQATPQEDCYTSSRKRRSDLPCSTQHCHSGRSVD